MIGILLDVLGIVVVLVIVVAAGMLVRRHLLGRGGTFDCSLRLPDRTKGHGWVLGIARYSGDVVEWYRVFSLATGPRMTFNRGELVVRSRRIPQASEALMLYADHIVVECVSKGQVIELAMTEDALTGFLAWIEAAPPGRARAHLES